MPQVGVGAALRAEVQLAIVAGEHDADLVAGEQPFAAAQDLVEHRLRVGDRAADDLQHLGGGGLLLERLLGLVEQAHVLDRDHRLVGEGLQQRDLLRRRSRPWLGAQTMISADGLALAHQRHEQTPSGSPHARRQRRACAANTLGASAVSAHRRSRAARGCTHRRRCRVERPGRQDSQPRPRPRRRMAKASASIIAALGNASATRLAAEQPLAALPRWRRTPAACR